VITTELTNTGAHIQTIRNREQHPIDYRDHSDTPNPEIAEKLEGLAETEASERAPKNR